MDNGSKNYERFLRGDKEGLVEIIKEYKDGLMLYINSIVKNIYVAEDLTEDTFVKLGTKRPKDNGKASFKTLLYTIGRNIAIDYFRKNRKRAEKEISLEEVGELRSEELSVEEQFIKQEDRRMLHRVIRGMKAEYSMVLWLIYFEDLSHKEVARIMKKSVHGVETLVYRARIRLKEELVKEGFSYEGL